MSKGTSAKRRAAVRRRRTLLTLLVLVVIAAVALFVWRPWEAPAEAPPETAPSESAPAESPAPEEPSETPEPTETQPFTPIGGNPTAEASDPCSAEQVRLTPQTDRSTYAADEPVQLSFTIENTGDAACSLDAGTAVQEYEIRTGDEVVYRWSDCAADVQENVVAIEPGQPQTTVPIEWDRTRSSADTCTAEREQVTAGGAAYNLSVRVGDFSSQEDRQFILE
ncbi:hypothetical protein [Agrococcus baldri]|uniref:DUF4232 domain-containing protein n=1 Tax=Agrococcus baldri TaxID=153730 RepID=A0AA87UY95_9MICO|nr:hypothetical protein [Agrococcus baldri]GEK81152.1 hypothetical protein ABA31_25030 [Agrococcus baldri]